MIEKRLLVSLSRSLLARKMVKKSQDLVNCPKPTTLYASNAIPDSPEKPKVIDFRSDTFSLPSKEMRAVISNAQVGDAVYNEDPTKIALEKKTAELFEREDAVFVTSGTMANLAAILVHCRQRPCEIIVGSKSHIILFEQVGAAQFGGVNVREVENNPDGTFNIADVKNKLRADEFYEPRTSLICVENTHNMLGGQIVPLEWLDELVEFAKSTNIPLHMDGARIFNAAIKMKVPVSRIVRGFDSINVCLSKSLGCPYGSMIVGSKEFITQARNVVKALGGGSRQIGFMAAAGIYALDNMVTRLQDDHDRIQVMANTIREMNHPAITVPAAEKIHTNILNVYLDSNAISANDFLAKLETVSKDGPNVVIRALTIMGNSIRFVACCNVAKSDMEDVIAKLRYVINELK